MLDDDELKSTREMHGLEDNIKEIEVGDYIRTKNNGIKKVYKIDDKKTINKYICYAGIDKEGDDYYIFIKTTDIIKSSKNIIDLVEVGDFVNGFLIDYIPENYNGKMFIRSERPYRQNDDTYKALKEKGKDYNMCLHFHNEDIETILTREQYEQNAYKVEV